jgi:hypothetical protein
MVSAKRLSDLGKTFADGISHRRGRADIVRAAFDSWSLQAGLAKMLEP